MVEPLKTARRVIALALLALGPSACGRGCTCVEGEKTYEKVHGKYELSLVRKTHWSGTKVPAPESKFFIHVETTPPFDEPVGDCAHVDMTEDKDGKHVAYRCRDTHEKEWTILRLRGGDRRLRECRAPVGTQDPPEWSKLESVRASTSRIHGCGGSDASSMRELTRAVLEDEGSAIAGAYVPTLAGLGRPNDPDPWDAAFDVLDPPARAAALDKLCPELARADGKAEPAAYVRAARRCPLVATGALPMLKAALQERAEDEGGTPTAMLWSGLLAAKTQPKEVGALLCDAMPGPSEEQRRSERVLVITALLGLTETKCAAIEAWLSPPPCSFLMDCDGGLCSRAELAGDLAGWDHDVAGARRSDPTLPPLDRALLRAAYGRGPLDPALRTVNARRRYDQADAGARPYCSDARLDAGAECECRIDPMVACGIPPKDTVLEQPGCTIRIDDAHRRFETPRHTCAPIGAPCSMHPCCGGASCQKGLCGFAAASDAVAD